MEQIKSFNPCFSGCRPATQKILTMLPTSCNVSILVLVDAALRLFEKKEVFEMNESFNPCFSGCRPATINFDIMGRKLDSFNPCFSGCRPATLISIDKANVMSR